MAHPRYGINKQAVVQSMTGEPDEEGLDRIRMPAEVGGEGVDRIRQPAVMPPAQVGGDVSGGYEPPIGGGVAPPPLVPENPGVIGGASQGPVSTSPSDGRWAPQLKAQMDAIGQKNGRQWRDDEYDQWIGQRGYVMKNDINGQGGAINAWSGGDIDPYWQWRMGTHARGDYNGDNPAELGAGDANMNKGKTGGYANTNMAMANGNASAIDPILSGDPMARIQAALAKLSGNGVNLESLIAQLTGAQ